MGIADQPTRSHPWSEQPLHPRVLAFWPGGSLERTLEPGRTLVVGRATETDLQILHPSVSRRQIVVRAGPPTTVEDLGSSHGTRVAGVLLRAHEARPLTPG